MFGLSECATEAVGAMAWFLTGLVVLMWPIGKLAMWSGRRAEERKQCRQK